MRLEERGVCRTRGCIGGLDYAFETSSILSILPVHISIIGQVAGEVGLPTVARSCCGRFSFCIHRAASQNVRSEKGQWTDRQSKLIRYTLVENLNLS